MTPRAESAIEALLPERETIDLHDTARELRQSGLDPSEAGWVLHHVFGLGMADAVHVAEVALVPDARDAP